METKPEVDLHNWEVAYPIAVFGDAKNHPVLGDASIKSSYIVRVDMNERIVETRNTIYRLIGESAKEQRLAAKAAGEQA
jgi:hypothetical protein